MKIINSNEKKVVCGSTITFLKYKLVSETIDDKTLYGIILSERILDGDDIVLTAPNFTNEYETALKLYNTIVESTTTADTFYDIFEDFFVC